MKKIFSLLIVALVFFAQAEGQVLENYDQSWVAYSGGNWLEGGDQIQVDVNVVDFEGSFFQIQVPKQSTLFIEGKLWEYFDRDTIEWIPVREIKKLADSDSATFILVNSKLGSSQVSIQKVINAEKYVKESTYLNESANSPRESIQSLKDFFVSALLINLILLAFYRAAYPYLLDVMIRPLSVINAEDFSDSGNLQKFFSLDILFYMIIVSMVLAQVAVTVFYLKADLAFNWGPVTYGTLMLIWLIGTVLIFALSVLKFLLIKVSGFFFELGKNDFAHFFYLLRLVVFGASIILAVFAFFIINRFWELNNVLDLMISAFFWFYLIGVSGMFFIMMNRLSFKKYHLFTYLCIAELVPFLILSKWIMVLVQ